jgi:hypothetical protein
MAATARRTSTGNTTAQGQIETANELLREVAEVNGEYANQVWAEFKRTWAQNACTFELVSARIQGMIDMKRASRHLRVVQDLPQIPDGRYAITGADGSTDFYRVTRNNKSKELRVFLYVSDDQRPVTPAARIEKVLRQIAKDGIEAANLRWALEMVRCRRCGAQLTDQNNPYRAQGYGPECGAK